MSFILHLFRTLEDILKVHIKNGYDSFVPKKFIKKKNEVNVSAQMMYL